MIKTLPNHACQLDTEPADWKRAVPVAVRRAAMKINHLNTGAHVFPQEDAMLVFGVGADFVVLKGTAAEVRKDEVCIHMCLVKLEDVVLLHAGKLALVVGVEGLSVGVGVSHKEIDGASDGVSVEVRYRVGDDSGGNHQVCLLVVETALCLQALDLEVELLLTGGGSALSFLRARMADWSVNASWEVPPQSWLNISDCDAISPWIAHIFVTASGTASSDASGHNDILVRIVVEFLTSLVPSHWTQPTDGDLLLWYLDFFDYIDEDRIQGIIMFSLQNCGPKICPKLGFSGDSDLSGIGVSYFHLKTVSYVIATMGSNTKQMMISYYMVAIFITLYYFAIAPGIMETYGGSLGSSQWAARYRKVASGFEGSVMAFLDAMLLFAISMLVAAVTRYSALILHPEETHSLFGLQNCVFLSAFAVFPAFVLQSVSRGLRRRRIRLCLWDLVFVFALVVEILYRLEYRSTVEDLGAIDSSTGSELSQNAWLSNCQSESLRQSLQTLLSVGHGIMLANCAWWLYNLADIYLGR